MGLIEIAKDRIATSFKDRTLPSAPTGPVVEQFNPVLYARALEQELARCRDYGWPKITIHMDVVDAAKLAAFLRR